jgi:hypothetical protein
MNATLASIIKPFASLRLTVTLLSAAMFLIFAGTLAQVEHGIWTVVERYFRSYIVWIDWQLFVPRSYTEVPGRFPFPGGFLIGGLLIVNLLAAHLSTFSLSRKRIGIVLLHTGIVLMLVGEFITGYFAVEGNMSIDEGQSANFVEDIRQVELAVIDPSPADHDQVAVVSQRLLRATGSAVNPLARTLRDPRLPFEVTVDRWMDNSVLFPISAAPDGSLSQANRGAGTQLIATPAKPITGVEEQTVNAPTAILTLARDGQPLGTWMVSLFLDQPQSIEVAGKEYLIGIRFKRSYKPYTIHLIDFRHDKFVGTDKPRNFSSLVRLVDPRHHEDRQALISMNNPLRYDGETFYQSAFKPGDGGTILQVVKNPGWLLPYISCALVTLGMLVHFLVRMFDGGRKATR